MNGANKMKRSKNRSPHPRRTRRLSLPVTMQLTRNKTLQMQKEGLVTEESEDQEPSTNSREVSVG